MDHRQLRFSGLMIQPKTVAFLGAAGLTLALLAASRSGPVPTLLLGVLVVLGAVPVYLRRSFSAAPVEGGGPGDSDTVLRETPVELSSGGSSRREALKRLSMGGAALAIPAAVGAPTVIDMWKAKASNGPATGPSGRTRQWGMIIDLRRCDGCQSQGTAPQCTLACIEGHFAPEPMEWIEAYEAEMAGGGTQFIPTPCQQCQNPPCVSVCPVTATFSTPEGPVLIDQDRCIGCRMCMAACPYDRRFFNWGDPPIPPEAMLADYSVEHQVPAKKGTVMKCDFCPEMARAGTLPYCVQACPNDAIYYGDLEEDVATNGREVVAFSTYTADNNSYRLKEELGTQPRVHYIPGHGELVGRDRFTEGRIATRWPWVERVKGAVTWRR